MAHTDCARTLCDCTTAQSARFRGCLTRRADCDRIWTTQFHFLNAELGKDWRHEYTFHDTLIRKARDMGLLVRAPHSSDEQTCLETRVCVEPGALMNAAVLRDERGESCVVCVRAVLCC